MNRTIQHKEAALLLYALQTASANMKDMPVTPYWSDLLHEFYVAPGRKSPAGSRPKKQATDAA